MSNLTLPPHGNEVYPWGLWTNGKTYRAKQGRHFHDVTPETFRRNLINRARRKGMAVETRVKGKVVTFKFSKKK